MSDTPRCDALWAKPGRDDRTADFATLACQLERELAEAKADAARYRWIKKVAPYTLGKIAHTHSANLETNFSTPLAVIEANVRGDVDGAIDAAIAAPGS